MRRNLAVWTALAMLSVTDAVGAGAVQGTVDWLDRIDLATGVSGIVADLAVAPGRMVAAGEPITRLDPTPFRAALEHARHALTLAAAELDEGRRELDRDRILYDEGSLSTVELDHSKLAHTRAMSTHARARAAVEEAEYRLRVSQVVAPFDLIVLATHVVPGQQLVAGCEAAKVATVARAGVLAVRAAVDSKQAAQLDAGAAVSALSGGTRMPAKVESVGYEPVGTSDTGAPLYPLVVRIEVPDMPRRVGEAATVEW